MSFKKIKFGDKEVDKKEFYSSKQAISLDSVDLDKIAVFIKMIDNIDFLNGFIYECAILINNLYDYNNYDHLAIKLCSEFVMPIINITKKEHIKEYNEHIKNIIDNLESTNNIRIICLYLIICILYLKMNI